ncbi:capsular polysaccharide biosynthesis protein [Clostridia bacterium]|nr:capsular polysaccharide biosynthesis protein [Clostridia bacterium]
MSKILILSNDNATIYNFRRELLKRLIDDKYTVVISVPDHERNKEFEEMGCTVEPTVLSRTGTNPINEVKLIGTYKKLIKKTNPDVVLTYTAKPNIYGSLACKSLGAPYINNITGLGAVFQSENIIKKIMLLLQKKAYKKSSCVFFQNKSNMSYFSDEKIVTKNAKLIPGSGVNLELHCFEEYPDDSSKIKIAFVSRIRKDKGFDELFEAIKELNKKHSNVEFHLVGWFEDDNYKAKIEEITTKYPVIYHGVKQPDEVHQIIKNCHGLIHPSHHEGLSNVLLEASATGRACLASNIAGCMETIDDDETGFLFEVKNSTSLVNAVEKFLNLTSAQRKEMGVRGRAKMEKTFDRNFVVQAYIDEIEKIC